MHLKISSAKWQPFCLGGDELSKGMAMISYQAIADTNDVEVPWSLEFQPIAQIPIINMTKAIYGSMKQDSLEFGN